MILYIFIDYIYIILIFVTWYNPNIPCGENDLKKRLLFVVFNIDHQRIKIQNKIFFIQI